VPDWDALTVEQQEAKLHKLALAALPAWNLEGSLSLIKQRENAVFKLTTNDGQRFALRVHRTGYHSDESLSSEYLWIEALRQAGLSVPNVVRTADGRRFVHASSKEVPQQRQIDLLEWCDGIQLASIEQPLPVDSQQLQNIFETIGRTMAAMHRQACAWTLPRDFVRHHWDRDGLVGPNPLWGQFWELSALSADQKTLIAQSRQRVSQRLSEIGQNPQTYSLIHADCVPENILIEAGTPHIIDFDDAGFGWHMFDIATALYFIQDDAGYETARQSLIDGYRESRPLSNEMLEQLPVFFAARSFTYLGWVHTRQKTQTAQELTPMLVQMCCAASERVA